MGIPKIMGKPVGRRTGELQVHDAESPTWVAGTRCAKKACKNRVAAHRQNLSGSFL